MFNPGLALWVTFGPGIVISLALLRVPLLGSSLARRPLYLMLALHPLHVLEEWWQGFPLTFPVRYDGFPFDPTLFLALNLAAYFLFVWAIRSILNNPGGVARLIALFFVVYGGFGNAVAHSYWCLRDGGYAAGGITAQAGWLVAPWALSQLVGRRATIIALAALTAILALTLSEFHR